MFLVIYNKTNEIMDRSISGSVEPVLTKRDYWNHFSRYWMNVIYILLFS